MTREQERLRHRWAWWRFLPRQVTAVWPHWPLAIAILLSGAINILDGLRYNIVPYDQMQTLSTIAESLSFLGSSAQMVLGVMLVLVGFGLFWRLTVAWAFAVLLLMVTVGVNIAQSMWGPSLILPGVLLLMLMLFRRHFTRRTAIVNYLISFIGVLTVLAYGTFGGYLLGAGFDPPIDHLLSALYYTVITLSTVGYGDITPVTPETRIFAISLIVVGLSIFAAAIVSTLGPFISSELIHIFNPGAKKVKPRDHIIITGEGQIAENTLRELMDRRIPFTRIVSPDAQTGEVDYPVVRGPAGSEDVLRKAGIENARMVVAAQDDDGENAFIVLAAKNLNPQVRIVATARTIRSLHLLKLAGADLVFAPAAVGSRLLANLVEGNEISSEFADLLEGKVRSGS